MSTVYSVGHSTRPFDDFAAVHLLDRLEANDRPNLGGALQDRHLQVNVCLVARATDDARLPEARDEARVVLVVEHYRAHDVLWSVHIATRSTRVRVGVWGLHLEAIDSVPLLKLEAVRWKSSGRHRDAAEQRARKKGESARAAHAAERIQRATGFRIGHGGSLAIVSVTLLAGLAEVSLAAKVPFGLPEWG